MKPLVLSCITFSDATYALSHLPIPAFVHDPRFHLVGLAILEPDGTYRFATDAATAIRELQAVYGQELERVPVVVHNGHVELFILASRFGLRPRLVIDTMDLAHAIDGRRTLGQTEVTVEMLADRSKLPGQRGSSIPTGIRHLDGRQRSALAQAARQRVTWIAALLAHYLPRLSHPMTEVAIAQHTLQLYTDPARHFCVDLAGIDALKATITRETAAWFQAAGITPEQAGQYRDFNRLLEQALARTGRQVPVKRGALGLIPATSKQDEAMQALVHDDDPIVAALAQARLSHGSQIQSVARLDTLRTIAMATRGWLPPYVVYHGASTGRFAGGGRFNLQNLPKRGVASQIRHLIGAAPGQVLVLVDLAQIECRVTAWLAQDPWMLDAFRQHADLYAQEASAIFGQPVRKPTAEDAPDLAASLTAMRQVGKQEVLGLGYGMGAERFLNTLRSDPLTAALLDQGTLKPDDCERVVGRFRGSFPRIPQLWIMAETAFRQALATGLPQRIGPCVVTCEVDTLVVTLPSQRALRYPTVRLEPRPPVPGATTAGGRTVRDGLVYGDHISIYGGKIVENLAQAIARDILVEAILRLEAQGICVMAHIHDEIIATCSEADGPRVLSLVTEALKRSPEWATDLPLEADGRIGKTLGK